MRLPAFAVLAASAALLSTVLPAQQVVTGQAAFADWNQQQPGVRRKVTLADLPAPYASESSNNQPHVIPRPADAWPIAPPGFKVTLYAGGDAAPMQRDENKQQISAPAAGTFNLQPGVRDSIYQPGLQDWNVSMFKRFVVRESDYFEFRAEAYDFINHPNWSGPNLNPTSGQFGEITSKTGLQRTLQLGLRFNF